MPQIPRAADITRVIPRGQQRVSVADTSQVGSGLMSIAGTMVEIQDDRARYQLSKAKSEFLKAKVQQDNAYANDEDYQTIPDRYQNRLQQDLDNAARIIEDPRARQLFMDDASVQFAQGYERIQTLAAGVERDYERGDLNAYMADAVNFATAENMVDTRTSVYERINNAVALNYITNQEAEQYKDSWRDQAFMSAADALEPEQRLAMLDEDWISSIDDSIVNPMRRDAEEQVRDIVAVRTYDQLVKDYPNVGERSEQINAIEDVELRLAVEDREARESRRTAMVQADVDFQLMEQYYPILSDPNGSTKFMDIAAADRNRMSPQLQEKLRIVQEQTERNNRPEFTDAYIQDAMFRMTAAQKFTDLRNYVLNNLDKIEDRQASQMLQIAAQGEIPEGYKSEFNNQQYVVARMRSRFGDVVSTSPATRRKRNQDIANITLMLNNAAASRGQALTDLEREELVDNYILDRVFTFQRPRSFVDSFSDVYLGGGERAYKEDKIVFSPIGATEREQKEFIQTVTQDPEFAEAFKDALALPEVDSENLTNLIDTMLFIYDERRREQGEIIR